MCGLSKIITRVAKEFYLAYSIGQPVERLSATIKEVSVNTTYSLIKCNAALCVIYEMCCGFKYTWRLLIAPTDYFGDIKNCSSNFESHQNRVLVLRKSPLHNELTELLSALIKRVCYP